MNVDEICYFCVENSLHFVYVFVLLGSLVIWRITPFKLLLASAFDEKSVFSEIIVLFFFRFFNLSSTLEFEMDV